MRHDLAFFLCCCKSFLGSPQDDQDGQESFYQLLGLERDASHEDIKRAYKRQSLQMHPDKLAQRGQKVTEADQAKFTRMKEAYECLSDPHKRETYDTIGERGMKWLEEPFSMDPQELAHNFAKSSALDRSKIFAIFVVIAIAVLLLPLLVCLHIDGVFGANASWMATLTPLWIWNVILLAYHVRIIMMGPIQRPEHIPPEEWVDPLPMKKRIFSMARFTLIVLFELLVALRLDKILTCKWTFVFVPLFIWEATTLYKRWPLARMRIVTVEDLEIALGKPFAEFTAAEKELIGKRYSVVPSTSSPDFEAAQKLKSRARQDMMKSLVRLVFVALLLVQIDGVIDWNWWLVFTPFWIMTVAICLANYQSFAAVQQMAADKDPTLKKEESATTATSEANAAETGTTNYGSVGLDGTATPEATKTGQPQSELSEAEREELKAAVMASGTKLCSKCCSQGFLLILICLFVAKLQGGGFSSLWIISPFLFAAGIILCCLGLAIFGITEVPTEGVEFDTTDFVVEGSTESMDGGATSGTSAPYTPPATTADAQIPSSSDVPSMADPELGEQQPQTEPPRVPSSVSEVSSLQPAPSSAQEPPTPIPPFVSQVPAELNELD